MHSHQIVAQLRSSPAGSGSGIVQFVHQTRSQRSQGRHLLLLQCHLLHLLQTECHVAQDGLANLRTRGHQVPELVFAESQQMARAVGNDADRIRSVGEQRQLAEGRTGRHSYHAHLVSVRQLLGDMELSLQQDPEVMVRLALPRFTLIGATTRSGLLTAPLLTRFPIRERLDYYQADQLQEIVSIGPITPGVSPIQIKESLPGAGLVFLSMN